MTLNKIRIPIPLPVNNPAIHEPNVIVLFKYSSVNITLAPQLGINPIKLEINELKTLSLKNIFDIVSSPKNSNPIFKKNEMININIVFLEVFFLLDLIFQIRSLHVSQLGSKGVKGERRLSEEYHMMSIGRSEI